MFYVWLVLLLFILLLFIIESFKYGITPNITSKRVRHQIDQILPSTLDGTIVDLGSGFGVLLFYFAKKYPSCQVIGYEGALIPYCCSKLLLTIFPYKNITILRQNFYETNFGHVGLACAYLYPKAMERLQSKLFKELPSNAWILSHTFAFRNKKAVKTLTAQDLYSTKVYLYRPDA